MRGERIYINENDIKNTLTKHKTEKYLNFSREIWKCDISQKAILLYAWLLELHATQIGEKIDFFYRTDEELAKDMSWSLKTLKKAKAELKKAKIINVFPVGFLNTETGEKSTECVTGYRIKMEV